MSPPPTSIDGTDITGATIDGQDVQEITIDGQTVFTAIDPNLIDNFEDSNGIYNTNDSLTDVGYTLSQSGAFARTTTRPFQGSISMECNTGSDGQQVRATPASTNLPQFPTRGEKFAFEVFLNNSNSGVILDFFSDNTFDNGLRYWIARDGWFFQTRTNGTDNTLYDSAANTPKGEFLTVEISSDSSTVTARTFDQSDNLLDEYQETTSINAGTAFGFNSAPSQGTFAFFVDDIRTL